LSFCCVFSFSYFCEFLSVLQSKPRIFYPTLAELLSWETVSQGRSDFIGPTVAGLDDSHPVRMAGNRDYLAEVAELGGSRK
jgi:hypothetical protein